MVRIVTSTDAGDVIGSTPIMYFLHIAQKVEHDFLLFLLYPLLFGPLAQSVRAQAC